MFDNEEFILFPIGSMSSQGQLAEDINCIEDPLAPICDIDSIFGDEHVDAPMRSSKIEMMHPKSLGSVMSCGMVDFSSGQGTAESSPQRMSCSWNLNRGESIIPMTIPSEDILSEVLDELDDITQDLRPDEIAALSADLRAPATFGAFVDVPPPSFKHLRPCPKPKRRVVSDESATEEKEVAVAPVKRQKVASDDFDECSGVKLRIYQAEKWHTKFDELVQYKQIHGHCQVPHGYSVNPTLARWAKRQRYQYKLYQENKPSTMTEERISALENLGFVWDSHTKLWDERYKELQKFVRVQGHANVPSTYPPNPKLAIWVKCQRRQYKLLVTGQASNMTYPRVDLLNKLAFVWEIRKTGYLP